MLDKDNKYVQVAERCLEMNIPFALYMFPDDESFHFVAAQKVKDISVADFCEKSPAGTFAISPFIPSKTIEVIVPQLTPEDILELKTVVCESGNENFPFETTFEEYSQSAATVISLLKQSGGKVVLSRVIVAEGKNPISVALSYFSSLPSTFRSIFYTPSKGIWLGATPEILAAYSAIDKKLHTMSLAGTRLYGTDGEWDEKNIEEHNFVTDFIRSVLTDRCGKIKISAPFSLRYDSVEHLCETIEAHDVTDFASVLSNLSPTPAVCGTPRDFALDAIRQAEAHSRDCYGGWLGVKAGGEIRTFVNLRCTKIYPGKNTGTNIYMVYAGGGFTAESVIEDEWSEAGQKASSLLKFLKRM